MIWFLIVACFVQSTVQESVWRDVITKGFKDYAKEVDADLKGRLKDIAFPGITLKNPKVSYGSLKTIRKPKQSEGNTYTALANHDGLKIKYEYSLGTGEEGHVIVRIANRTYSMLFHSMPVKKFCDTSLLHIQLKHEEPISINAKGDNEGLAETLLQKMRNVITQVSRSFSYLEIVTAMNESLSQRKPKLCTSYESIPVENHQSVSAKRGKKTKSSKRNRSNYSKHD